MSEFTARRLESWDAVPDEWRDPARATTPFQTGAFLGAWYETLGREPDVKPAIVEVRAADGRAAALWPLVCYRNHKQKLWEVGFADGELTDNCVPLTGEGFAHDPNAFAALWRATMMALPPADVLRFAKSPQEIGGSPNPMTSLSGAFADPLSRHIVDMPGTFEEYSASRTTKFSKEQRRVWRVFTRNEGAAFEIQTDPSRALMLFAQFETLQEARMREIGVNYRLGAPAYREFSRRLIERGVADGSVVFGALTAGNELVGGLIGLTNGRDVAFVRICFAPGKWTASSPGRLVLEKTIEALHARGFRSVDLSVGDFPYKYDFGVRLEPLSGLLLPLSLRGRPTWARHAVRQRLKKSAWVRALRDRWATRGKKAEIPNSAG
jgi:CelD/BcsL family acetyltransferase involved in cellulose biosynthesis